MLFRVKRGNRSIPFAWDRHTRGGAHHATPLNGTVPHSRGPLSTLDTSPAWVLHPGLLHSSPTQVPWLRESSWSSDHTSVEGKRIPIKSKLLTFTVLYYKASIVVLSYILRTFFPQLVSFSKSFYFGYLCLRHCSSVFIWSSCFYRTHVLR